ncbi:hypothetical protein BRADI_2g58030v3 [Brachypodium distachyon]|uniref:TF-B3 domain-containing protein n=1 Tax=Brachypodium distachyon TaxID=15368 RepID=A0A2K2DGK9_BRADI|nr:hypothetical protein BRADI_2g58030v3 [Brachypodium distachyon]
MLEMVGVKKEQDESQDDDEEVGAKMISRQEKITSQKGEEKKKRKMASDPHRKRACVDCTKRCARVHGRSASPDPENARRPAAMPTLPSFFKVMMGYFSETMVIPPPFAKTIKDLKGSNVYLEDAFGLRWRVRVCSDDGLLSFGHGWKNFVLDHAIGAGEFLVFRQIARTVFAVQIFARSACERLYFCEKNQRQSRKRKKAREKTGKEMVKVSQDNGDRRSGKKQRSSYNQQDDLGTVTLLDAETETAADCTILHSGGGTETEDRGGSNFPTSPELATPLATMDINDEITDDIFLTADVYEFETDFCDPEAFSVEVGLEEHVAHGHNSGFSCGAEMSSRNCDSSVGVCLENREMADVPVTSTAGNDPVLGIGMDINELSVIRGEKSYSEIDAEMPSSECAIDTCKRFGENLLLPPDGNQIQVQRKEGSSEKQDSNLQLQECPGQIAGEVIPANPKPRERPGRRQKNHMQSVAGNNPEDLKTRRPKASDRKFVVAVPPPDQTWLDLPCRLPAVVPRAKKQGRKVLVLEDPRARRWPVLYQCTPRFSGFIAGWVDVCRENGLREGDACELELRGNSELELRVRPPGSSTGP